MKLIFYAVLAYFLVRAVANLLRAMRRKQRTAAGRFGPDRSAPRNGRSRNESARNGGSRDGGLQQRATRLDDAEEVEDARWEDL